ncbi:MAG: 1-deoxy-D-xylulose-5-phosphate reductoisomerase [Proteobacteria bacterium]|nr:1-deoxy-D-xylulose-5-phosphate reductoisomerase [Pseudomonadota bacterium]
MTTRSVTILGSTGSIGTNTLDLVRRHPDRFSVMALTANRNVDKLIEQARAFRPEIAVIGDESHYQELVDGLQGTGIEAASGEQALVDAATLPSDWLMGGIVGAAGLRPTLAAIRRGAIVALANKECLVCAGELVMEEVRTHGATLLPVDSEHNAIFQVFDRAAVDSIRRIILTASGGPFRTMSKSDMAAVTPDQAVAHPNWKMGAKISVDSATMMNKGLEYIEAFHLFPIEPEQIDILVHPQSVVHSMVEYQDGSVLAQMGSPDMRTPIAYSLNWPKRMDAPVERLDLAKVGTLTFEEPDPDRFPAIPMAQDALAAGGSAPTVLNAANEIAVHAFLEKRIGFLDICDVVAETLARIPGRALASLDDVYDVDREARDVADSVIQRLN